MGISMWTTASGHFSDKTQTLKLDNLILKVYSPFDSLQLPFFFFFYDKINKLVPQQRLKQAFFSFKNWVIAPRLGGRSGLNKLHSISSRLNSTQVCICNCNNNTHTQKKLFEGFKKSRRRIRGHFLELGQDLTCYVRKKNVKKIQGKFRFFFFRFFQKKISIEIILMMSRLDYAHKT